MGQTAQTTSVNEQWLDNQVKDNPTRFSSLKGEAKNCNKKIHVNIYSTMKIKDTEMLG